MGTQPLNVSYTNATSEWKPCEKLTITNDQVADIRLLNILEKGNDSCEPQPQGLLSYLYVRLLRVADHGQ